MRNKLPGPCFRCEDIVEPGDGYYQRVKIAGKWGWHTQHKTCALRWRDAAQAPTVVAAKWAREMDLMPSKDASENAGS